MKKKNPLDDVTMLEQPFLTEDGFVNEACMNELAGVLAAMPPDYERLADDPEWNTKRITHWREITGGLAQWAIRNIHEKDDTAFPPGLENMIGLLTAIIRPKFDKLGWADLSLCDINKMLRDALWNEPTFMLWNDEKILKGWLDLDALLRNVCIEIRMDRRAFDKFNADFDAEYGEEPCHTWTI